MLSTLDQPEVSSKKVGETTRDNYYEMARELDTLDTGHVAVLLDQTETHAASAQARAITRDRKQFTSWAKKAWATKSGILHKHTKEVEPPKLELAVSEDRVVADPDTIMKYKAEEWGKIWTDPVCCGLRGEMGPCKGYAWTYPHEIPTC